LKVKSDGLTEKPRQQPGKKTRRATLNRREKTARRKKTIEQVQKARPNNCKKKGRERIGEGKQYLLGLRCRVEGGGGFHKHIGKASLAGLWGLGEPSQKHR